MPIFSVFTPKPAKRRPRRRITVPEQWAREDIKFLRHLKATKTDLYDQIMLERQRAQMEAQRLQAEAISKPKDTMHDALGMIKTIRDLDENGGSKSSWERALEAVAPAIGGALVTLAQQQAPQPAAHPVRVIVPRPMSRQLPAPAAGAAPDPAAESTDPSDDPPRFSSFAEWADFLHRGLAERDDPVAAAAWFHWAVSNEEQLGGVERELCATADEHLPAAVDRLGSFPAFAGLATYLRANPEWFRRMVAELRAINEREAA